MTIGTEILQRPKFGATRLAIQAALATLVVAPFLATNVPAFGDTLNHLARMHVLAGIAQSPALQRYYAVRWQPIPYLAMDALVPPLARLVGIYAAGKMFVCACVLMPALATAVLHYAVHRRISLVPAAAFLLCGNYLLALGFLGFLFTSGLAIVLFAAWIATTAWPRIARLVLFTPCLTLLYLGHAYAALAYCLCVAGHEAARVLRAGQGAWPASALDLAAAGAQSLPALWLAATLDVQQGYVGALVTSYGAFGAKLLALFSPGLLLIDPLFAITIAASLALLLGLRRHIRLAPAIWPALLPVGLAAAAMPHVLASTWGMDYRLPLVAAMLLIGGASLPAAGRWRIPTLAALAATVAIRSGDSWTALRTIDAQVAETRQVLAGLPSGARLLVVNPGGHGTGLERIAANAIWNMPLVAVIDQDAFLPTLFSGLTTVQVRPAYRNASTPNGLPISPDQLREGAAAPDSGTDRTDGQGARLYYGGWPAKFDYVLIQSYGLPVGKLPANLRQVAGSANLVLYRIVMR